VHILHVIAARPNFMKVAPVQRAFAARGVKQTLVHTGQHYDANMSGVFFEQLGIPEPDLNLSVGSGSHARQTAEVMIRLEPVLQDLKPDAVLVYGDVNSTAAAAMVCAKSGVVLAHVEAGLRSNDRSMPEEINRLVTDQLADVLLCPSYDAVDNLRREGIDNDKIFLVGNVMIDTLIKTLPFAASVFNNGFPERFALVTLHRPSNVDDPATLRRIMDQLDAISKDIHLIFPVHPRTRQRLSEMSGNSFDHPHIRLCDPLPYVAFLGLQTRARFVITDSGGIQEETTYLGVPCLTMRNNTERPVTIEVGTNILVGNDGEHLLLAVRNICAGRLKAARIPELWDGRTSERIVTALETYFERCQTSRAAYVARRQH
jgi:UDP-N-acetylglucosamine 2-epimerase (non-hydrolysing)